MEARQLFERICEMQARAATFGMRVECQLGIDMYGRHTINSLNVLKVL